MRSIRTLASAAEEAAEAIVWYEREQPGLGREFQNAIDSALDLLEGELIPLVPVSGKRVRRDLKRLLLSRFPYAVIVLERPTEYVVVAFMHFSRRPGYWRDRIRDERPKS